MVWEIAWKLKHKTVCFVFFIVVFYLQIFKKSANSVKKQSRFCYGSLNKIPLPIKRLREQHCFVKLEFFLVHFSMYIYELSYVLFEKINPDIAKMLALCCVFWCVRKSRNSQEEKKFKLSQLVDIVIVVFLSYFFCHLFQIAVF